MKLTKSLFLAVFVSSMLALMLSFIPTVEMKQLNWDRGVTVFGGENRPSSIMNGQTVPDLLLTQSYHQTIHRIEWQPSILTVDFLVNEERNRTDDVYSDLYQVVEAGLFQTSNVNEVLVRVYMGTQNDVPELALALIAKRENMGTALSTNRSSSEEVKDWLQTYCDITYKPVWKKLSY